MYLESNIKQIEGVVAQFLEKRSSNRWHLTKDYCVINYKEISVSFADNPSGCGSVIMFNCFSYLTKNEFAELIEILKPIFKKDGIGAILYSLGQSFYPKEEYLKKIGFVEIAEYNNWRHGRDYRQKQFILIIE